MTVNIQFLYTAVALKLLLLTEGQNDREALVAHTPPKAQQSDGHDH